MKHAMQLLPLLCSALCTPALAFSAAGGEQRPLVHPLSTSSDDDAPSYRSSLLGLHRALVEVPSISGDEGRAAVKLEKILKSLNYTVELQRLPSSSSSDDQPDRFNVLAWPGPDANRTFDGRVLVTSHIDVVPPYIPYRVDNRTAPPNPAYTKDTFLSGRGSVDAKASVAAQIIATTDLLSAGSIPPEAVVLLFVVGEETSGQGMKYFSQWLSSSSSSSLTNTTPHPLPLPHPRPQFTSAIFGEPTENRLACGHKGILGATLTAHGRAGHSGYPWLGRSATALLVRALDRLLSTDLGSSERYGNTTVNVGVIEGGVAANVIAKEARARVAVRIAVGEQGTGAGIVGGRMAEVVREVEREEGADGEGEEGLELELTAGYGPVECECAVDGFETMVANYGTDVPNLEGDHVRYLYGPGSILVAHGDDEGLRVRDLEEAVEGYKRLIQHAVEAS